MAAGTNHHVAFRVKDDNILMDYREKIEGIGLNITPKIDRDYFSHCIFGNRVVYCLNWQRITRDLQKMNRLVNWEHI